MIENNNLLEKDIDKLIKFSNYKILDFKTDLNIIYNIIFKFCNDNDVLIYNPNINISKINNTKYEMKDINTDFTFIILTPSPKKHSNELLDIVYKNYSKYVSLSYYIHYSEIILTIDNNKLVYFNLLLDPKINSLENINYIDYKYKDYKLKIVSNELTLMILLHKLYNPSIFLDILKGKSNYLEIYNTIISQFKFDNAIVKNTQKLLEFKHIILNDFYNVISSMEIDIVLLDSYAIGLLNKKDSNIETFNSTLNLILSIKNNIIKLFVKIIEDILKKNKIEYKRVIYSISNIYILNDFRLKKVNIFVVLKNDQKITLLNIFNSIEYEVLPIVKKISNIYIPHEFVIIRFILLNLISMQLYDKNLKKTTIDKYKNEIYTISKLNNIYKEIIYIGNFKDEKIDKFNIGVNTFRPKFIKSEIIIDDDL